jgi:hypothetical protein
VWLAVAGVAVAAPLVLALKWAIPQRQPRPEHQHRLADTWPPEGPPVLWSRELGQGHLPAFPASVGAARAHLAQQDWRRGAWLILAFVLSYAGSVAFTAWKTSR